METLEFKKIELIELLLSTSKESVLDKVKELLTKNNDVFSEEDYLIIDKRRENHINGLSVSHNWDDIKNSF